MSSDAADIDSVFAHVNYERKERHCRSFASMSGLIGLIQGDRSLLMPVLTWNAFDR